MNFNFKTSKHIQNNLLFDASKHLPTSTFYGTNISPSSPTHISDHHNYITRTKTVTVNSLVEISGLNM
jgi:hypothetical protein